LSCFILFQNHSYNYLKYEPTKLNNWGLCKDGDIYPIALYWSEIDRESYSGFSREVAFKKWRRKNLKVKFTRSNPSCLTILCNASCQVLPERRGLD
jgi:hypothetical protein